MLTRRLAPKWFAAFVIPFVIASCTTQPPTVQLPRLPDPPQCHESCRVNSCTLSKFYALEGTKDEDRVAEEINCAAVNANDARLCAALLEACSAGLKERALMPSR